MTSVPPGRTSGAVRWRTSPPITSKATSTSPASSSRRPQVHERVRTQAEGGLPVPGPAGADHAGAQLVCELHRDGPDAARGAVDQDGLAGLEVGVVEQALPGGQPGDGQGGGHGVVDVRRKRGEVAGLHRGVLGQGPVAGPVGQSEHPLAHGQAGGAVAQLGDNTRQLVSGHARGPVVAGAVGPCARPVQLPRGEPGCVDAHDHVVFGRVGVGDIGQRQPGGTGGTVSYGDGLHNGPFCDEIRFWRAPPGAWRAIASAATAPQSPPGGLSVQRFSEMIRAVISEGPQVITRHGEDVAVVVDIGEYRRLTRPPVDLASILLGGPKLDDGAADVFAEIEAERKADFGRVLDLEADA